MGRFSVTVLATMLLLLVFGCENDSTDAETIKELTCDVTSTNVTTNGGSDGTITVNVLTGNNNYVYTLNGTNINYNGRFTNLTAGTYQLKVIDSKNKEYNKSVTITQPDIVPIISTVETPLINVISLNDVTLNSKVNPNGFATTSLYFEYSISNTYTNSVKLNLSNVSGNTLTPISIKITSGLSYNTTYYVRLVAINAGGTKISQNNTFYIQQPPTINTYNATNITSTSVTLNGQINPNGNTITSLYFEYSISNTYTNSIKLNLTSNVSGNVNINMTTFNSQTKYYYRLVAEINGNIINGNTIEFITGYKVGAQLYGGTIFKVDGVYPNQTGLIAKNNDVYDYYNDWLNAKDYKITDENNKTWRTPNETELLLLFTLNSTLNSPYVKLKTGNAYGISYWTSSSDNGKGIAIIMQSQIVIRYFDIYVKLTGLRLITTF